jgi:hypothetical protein
MNDLRGRVPDRQVRRGIAVVLSALLVPPGTLLLLRMVPAPRPGGAALALVALAAVH